MASDDPLFGRHRFSFQCFRIGHRGFSLAYADEGRIEIVEAVLDDLEADLCADARKICPSSTRTQACVFLTDTAMVAISSGLTVLRSITSTLIPFLQLV